MTSATDPHPDLLAEPSARTFPLAQLVSLIREGKVRIPHFQRGLRWGTPDAVALIDSVLREIYDRMNNAGKRLTRAEVFRGLFAPEENATEATTFETIQEEIRERLRWGNIDLDTILHAFLATRGPDVYRDIHLEFSDERKRKAEFPDENNEEAHQRALQALERAIDFLRNKTGVPHFTFLAYRFLLVVATRFFTHFPAPSQRNLDLLKRWYWRTALAGPTLGSGGTTGIVRSLASCILPEEENESVQRLLKTVTDKPRHSPKAATFGSNRASGHIMLCALWAKRPLSPDTGLPFTDEDLALEIEQSSSPRPACPEVFPRTALPEELRNSLGNRVIAPGIPLEAVREIPTSEDQVRDSHFFRNSSDPQQTVRDRQEMLQRHIDDFLRSHASWDIDDSPPLASLDLDSEPEEDPDPDDEEDGEDEHKRLKDTHDLRVGKSLFAIEDEGADAAEGRNVRHHRVREERAAVERAVIAPNEKCLADECREEDDENPVDRDECEIP